MLGEDASTMRISPETRPAAQIFSACDNDTESTALSVRNAVVGLDITPKFRNPGKPALVSSHETRE